MATTRQKIAKRTERTQAIQRGFRDNQEQRKADLAENAKIPAKGKPQAEFTTLTGEKVRTILSPVALATVMAQEPRNLLELPIVDKRGNVSASWFRAGSIIFVVDLTGMRAFPR